MPNQDLLLPILPRSPAAPNPADIKRDVTKISPKNPLLEARVHNDAAKSQQHSHSQKKLIRV